MGQTKKKRDRNTEQVKRPIESKVINRYRRQYV